MVQIWSPLRPDFVEYVFRVLINFSIKTLVWKHLKDFFSVFELFWFLIKTFQNENFGLLWIVCLEIQKIPQNSEKAELCWNKKLLEKNFQKY